MKKIRSIADLSEEKMKLRIEELELEKKIERNWRSLKDKLDPKVFWKESLQDETTRHWIITGLNAAVSFITGRIRHRHDEKHAHHSK
jgi:hypothetical protein